MMTDILDLALVPKRVADALGSDIIFGRLEPDSRVVEEEVAERFGVSRSPVRESIRLLERDGLVVRAERRGARVSPMSQRDLDEVYACRLCLEGLAAAEAATRRRAESLVALEAGLTQLQRAFQKSDIRAYFEANVAFTDAVHIAADNPTLRRLLGSIGKQALRYRFLAYRKFPELMAKSVEGNKDVVAAIRAGDAEAARAETERLIKRSWEAIRSAIEKNSAITFA
jgi:DNA-binding GntR family transcriptional regulator